jgi:murein DD-endopeptidase MepM/ murein hydrolase activator NlpD
MKVSRQNLKRTVALTVSTFSALVLLLAVATPASAKPVQPRDNDGWISITKRICGTSKGWQKNAERNKMATYSWLYMNHSYNIECDTPVPRAARDPQPQASRSTTRSTGWVHPLGSGLGISCWGDERDGGARKHKGVDLPRGGGTPIHAVAAGTVHSHGYDVDRRTGLGGGHYVVIDHGGNVYSIYMHMQGRSPLADGTFVGSNAVIGRVGTSGANGYHLHFEVHVGRLWKDRINPAPFMRDRGVNIGC